MEKYLLLFETGVLSKEEFKSYLFRQPLDVIKVFDYSAVEEAFAGIQEYSRKYYLCGYFSYELGYAFEKNIFKPPRRSKYPLIHMCVFKEALVFDHRIQDIGAASRYLCLKEPSLGYKISKMKFNLSEKDYRNKVHKIRQHIKNGDTYQVNFTGKLKFNLQGSAFGLYQDLKLKQPVPYSAFLKLGDEYVISLSPELYFRREKDFIYSRPMKGTLARGADEAADLRRARELGRSSKNRAENLMIVDLIRNDLGRVSRTGKVSVARMFDIEKYNTLFQMTSTVSARLAKKSTYLDIFRSTFPGGSVTGAPKIRTMQIIRELEGTSRNIYCGALGIISPGNKAVFNLPIRTISVVKGKAEMGVGSGIVIDSRPRDEYRECLLKAKFLTDKRPAFRLLETMLWDAGFIFLKEHLQRMANSAAYFGFNFDRRRILCCLKEKEKHFNKGIKYRARLSIERKGRVFVEHSVLAEPGQKIFKVAISPHKTDPADRFLYHKTTSRRLYDAQYARYSKKGYFDVIFRNSRNEFTEGAISNIIIARGARFYTPPVSSGLLAGIYRDYFIRRFGAKEKPLFLKDLLAADKVFLCNSVRGLTEVKLDNVHSRGLI